MRYIYLIGFVLVLGFPFVVRRAALPGEGAAHRASGGERLIILTPHNGDIRREFSRAFDAWYRSRFHQGATLEFRVPGGTTDMVHQLTTTFKPGPDGKLPAPAANDPAVVWGGGDYTFYHSLQPLGILEPMHLDPAALQAAFPEPSLAGVRLYDGTRDAAGDPTTQWVGVCLSSFGIIYNPTLYARLQMSEPASWSDLTDPRLFGLVALADPAHSGSAAVSYMMVIQRAMADAEEELFRQDPQLARLPKAKLRTDARYRDAIGRGWKRGMGQLLLIAANARYLTDSSEMVPNDVSRGEAAAGVAIDFYARVTEGTVGPERARFIAPRAATAITPDPVAIVHGVTGQRLTVAMRFVEFLLTPEAQRLWILLPGQPGGPIERSPRRMPIRRDVYADQTGWADHFNPFIEAGSFNQRGEWMALMSDTMPIWDAAWIDSRDALLAAYQAVLSVPEPDRRQQLLAELADLPISMGDIEQRRAQRLQLEHSHADVAAWQARDRIRWGALFREHNRRVEQAAH